MKKHSKSSQRSEPTLKRTKARGPVQRDAKEVLAEVLGKLTGKLDAPAVSSNVKESRRGNTVGPNRDRLTVGVDLGDRWSQYCILGLEGETLAEGQLRTTQEDVGEFFQAMTAARVVIEVGTHSAWVQDVITEWGHEVLVANPRLMEGSKRRKRKSDRIDANKLARLGRVDPPGGVSIPLCKRPGFVFGMGCRGRVTLPLPIDVATLRVVIARLFPGPAFVRATES